MSLECEESQVVTFDPDVHPQGSFRYGTVIRLLLKEEEYDLDLVCTLLELSKDVLSQQDVKDLVGQEIKAYAESNGRREPVREKRRCWRLDYADDVSFHMDILPALPDDDAFKASLVRMGVPKELAAHAIAITDREHPLFTEIQNDWPRSNPKGYAQWFESRMRSAAQARTETLVLEAKYASIDDVPAFEWKTPLQRAIQLLKRHRDVILSGLTPLVTGLLDPYGVVYTRKTKLPGRGTTAKQPENARYCNPRKLVPSPVEIIAA